MRTQQQIEAALGRVLTARGLTNPAYAVVVPVVCGPGGAELLIEVRAAGIPQAGDPCFPGGRIEPGETPARAASRELEEETGLRVPPELFLGQLPTVRTVLGGQTNIFVCTVTAAEADASHATPGNGLGLTLARRVAELHGGTAAAASAAGETTVTITLPLD